jgi:hypothetical protein
MGEDFDNHRRIFDSCPETVERDGDDLQSAAVARLVFDVDLSGANAVLESLSDWHRKLIEIGRARWEFTTSAAW